MYEGAKGVMRGDEGVRVTHKVSHHLSYNYNNILQALIAFKTFIDPLNVARK